MSKQKITLTHEQTHELINHLQGTSGSLDDILKEIFNVQSFTDLDIKTLSEIDNHLFQCEGCGWWCDLGDMSSKVTDESVCESCEDDYLG